MLEIMYLNVYTFSFVNYLTTFVICLPTNFYFLLYFTKCWSDRQFSVTADLSIHLEFCAQNVACVPCSAHSCPGASILWYHWVLELVSKESLLCICAVWPCRSTGQGLAGKGTGHQAYWPEFDPKDPLGGRSELYLQIIVWILNLSSDGIHIHAITLHMHTHIYIHTQNIHTHVEHIHVHTHVHT